LTSQIPQEELEKRAVIAAARNYSLRTAIEVTQDTFGLLTINQKRTMEDIYTKTKIEIAQTKKHHGIDSPAFQHLLTTRFCYYCAAPTLSQKRTPICNACAQTTKLANNVYQFPTKRT